MDIIEEIVDLLENNGKYDANQLRQIQEGLEDANLHLYANPKYDHLQMKQIRMGIKNKVNVLIYAKPEFTWRQMEQIRLGLVDDIDVSVYAKPEYNQWAMYIIRQSLIDFGVNISSRVKQDMTLDDVRELYTKLEEEFKGKQSAIDKLVNMAKF